MSMARMQRVEFYHLVAVALVLTIVVINRVLRSRYGRAFEALRDSPIASRLHGRERLPVQGLAFVLERRLRRPGGRAVRLFRAIYRAQQFLLRAVDPCSCWRSPWAGASRALGRSWARRSSSICPTCSPTSTCSASSPAAIAAVALVAGAASRAARAASSCAASLPPVALCVALLRRSRCCCRRSPTTS